MSNVNNQRNLLLRFLCHPLFGVGVGIVGIALAAYFYYSSREVPELTYFVHPAKAAVVRTGQTSHLTVQFDGQNFSGDVTAAQVAFWNAGRRPIHGNGILSPLVIRTGNKERILEVRLQKTSRDVTRLSVDTSRLSAGEVEVRWDILEQNDGGVLQIVYAGDETVSIEAHAILEGQPEVVRLDYSQPLATPGEQYTRRLGWRSWAFGGMFILMGSFLTLTVVMSVLQRARAAPGQKRRWFVPVFGMFVIALSFGSAIWTLFFERPPGPPFGF